MASPNVVAHVDQRMLTSYPTMAEIESVENYVYASKNATLDQLAQEAQDLLGSSAGSSITLAACVFTNEYRPAPETPHKIHADQCFARTGISRVGTIGPKYEPKTRGFQVFSNGDDQNDIRVLPCRYSVYLAVRSKGRRDRFGPVFSGSAMVDDAMLDFWVPIHKLFDGDECISGIDLSLSLETKHYNQKIAKLVGRLKATGFSNVPSARLNEPDFQFSEGIAEMLPDGSELGSFVLQPVPQPFVEVASFEGDNMSFEVPPMGPGSQFSDAFSPSLSVDSPSAPPVRPWPEYAHIRQRTDSTPPEDLNLRPDVVDIANVGGYDAQHYKDFAGEGWVTPIVLNSDTPLVDPSGQEIEMVSACSLVTAPDFYPNVSQRQVYEWWRETSVRSQNGELPDWWDALVSNGTWGRFWRRSPEPLSDERFAPNFRLPNSPFKSTDKTCTGIVTPLQSIDLSQSEVTVPNSMRHSFLPDHAAGAFAPGWDASVDRSSGVNHLTAYGLGSPFPEDAKLCAALSTFWPAAAPDVTRTFFRVPFANGSVCPMTDDEIGVGGDGVAWDGITGPFVVSQNATERVIEYPDFDHADYTRAALNGQFSIAKTSKVSLDDYKHRILATLRCYRAIANQGNRRATHIFSFRHANFDAELNEASMMTGTSLLGPVYRFELFTDQLRFSSGQQQDNVSEPVFQNNNHQARYRVGVTWTVFVGTGQFVISRWQQGDGSAAIGNWSRIDV